MRSKDAQKQLAQTSLRPGLNFRILHFENRRGEGPGDEVEFDVTSGPR